MPRFSLRRAWNMRSCYYCSEKPTQQKDVGGFFILACNECARRYANVDSLIVRVVG